MAKHEPDEQTEIFLGQWLDFFGMSVTEAARVAGCKQSYISNIIANRKTNVNVLYLLRISEALSVNVNDFYRPLPKKSELRALKELSPKPRSWKSSVSRADIPLRNPAASPLAGHCISHRNVLLDGNSFLWEICSRESTTGNQSWPSTTSPRPRPLKPI